MKNGNITDDEINNAKQNVIASIKSIPEEQDLEIIYYFGHELSHDTDTLEEYEDKIKEIEKKDILQIAENVCINTIYFLKN